MHFSLYQTMLFLTLPHKVPFRLESSRGAGLRPCSCLCWVFVDRLPQQCHTCPVFKAWPGGTSQNLALILPLHPPQSFSTCPPPHLPQSWNTLSPGAFPLLHRHAGTWRSVLMQKITTPIYMLVCVFQFG